MLGIVPKRGGAPPSFEQLHAKKKRHTQIESKNLEGKPCVWLVFLTQFVLVWREKGGGMAGFCQDATPPATFLSAVSGEQSAGAAHCSLQATMHRVCALSSRA